jgi:Na+-driven multidrug efflux pump
VHEIVALAVPVLMSQAIEPVAQLLDTAYVGRLGKSVVLYLNEE